MRQSIFFIILFCFLSLNAMKRARSDSLIRFKYISSAKERHVPYRLLTLPPDIKNIIFELLTTNTTERDYPSACSTVTTIACINTTFNLAINNSLFLHKLTEEYTKKFQCSHESITRSLAGIEKAKETLVLQMKLKNLVSTVTNKERYKTQLDALVTRNINFNFVYNYQNQQLTALMIALMKEGSASKLINLLVKAGADVNGKNVHGQTPLYIQFKPSARMGTSMYFHFYSTVQLNHQDNTGKTPLFYVITKYGSTHPAYVTQQVEWLLRNGADPEIPNNKGLTPLLAAKDRGLGGVVELINAAILKKNSL